MFRTSNPTTLDRIKSINQQLAHAHQIAMSADPQDKPRKIEWFSKCLNYSLDILKLCAGDMQYHSQIELSVTNVLDMCFEVCKNYPSDVEWNLRHLELLLDVKERLMHFKPLYNSSTMKAISELECFELSVQTKILFNNDKSLSPSDHKLAQDKLLFELNKHDIVGKAVAYKPYHDQAPALSLKEYRSLKQYGNFFTKVNVKILKELYAVFNSYPTECLEFLKPIDEYIRAHQSTKHFEEVPQGDILKIGAHNYPLPPAGYQPITHKGRLLQRAIDSVLSKYGIDVLNEQQTFCGFVLPEIANELVSPLSQGTAVKLFADNVAFGNALIHEKYTHMLEMVMIAKMLEEGYKGMCFPEGDRAIFLHDLLGVFVNSKSTSEGVSLWTNIMDRDTASLSQTLEGQIKIASVEDFTSILLCPSTVNAYAESMPYLSGYIRSQFFQQIRKLIDLYHQSYGIEISPEFLLASNEAAADVFNSIRDVVISTESYYTLRGYKPFTDTGGNPCFKHDEKDVLVYINGNVVTKVHLQPVVFESHVADVDTTNAELLAELPFFTSDDLV